MSNAHPDWLLNNTSKIVLVYGQDDQIRNIAINLQLSNNIHGDSFSPGVMQYQYPTCSHSLIYLKYPVDIKTPERQLNYMDSLIKSVNRDKNKFIIETNSEALALRVLRRIRETSECENIEKDLELTPEDVSFFYFDRENNIYKIRCTNDGDFIDPWPNGFFNWRGKELF